MSTWANIYFKTTDKLERLGMPVLIFIIRYVIAKIFFLSGLTKISNWPGTVALFTQDYKVPLLSPEIAAYLAASAELICPILLILGLGTRFAALALLIMTAVIQYTYPGYIEHTFWALLLITIIFYGAGKFSLDYHIKKKYYTK
ncbi:MAG: DoxX family protein [Legionellales bacterium]|jgi:putative oxidoreductase